MPLDANCPLLLPLFLLVAVIGLGIMGMLLATTFVLYRHANALSNLLEYPVWIATGMLAACSSRLAGPDQLGPLPTWAVEAIRGAAIGAEPPWLAIAMCLILAVIYYVIARRVLVYVIDKARRDATLNLA